MLYQLSQSLCLKDGWTLARMHEFSRVRLKLCDRCGTQLCFYFLKQHTGDTEEEQGRTFNAGRFTAFFQTHRTELLR